ncbi:hypothetical protein [Mucilaginibacter terrae]|uniref:Uncharacterized protein n=1 Tax=Mucilaginibacter terrae TaxID=1955052 RepID=A0ABU3GN58_9SPHI|nr:hypothetical protein [Mucilaginibacter terrae]MDT3401220.1 hypothetical protein [Mucilaginibacter terrae]
MAKINIYPTKYELVEVLTSITNRGFLNVFAQNKGIFITHVDTATLAKEISNLFLDNDDLESIRKEAYNNNSSHALSGFVLKSKNKDFNLKNDYQSLFDDGKQKMGQVLNQLVRIKGTNIYKGSIEYNKKRAGRIEFLQDEVTHFDFYIEEKSPGTWQVEVDGNRSTDSKELKDLLNGVLDTNTVIQDIEQALLNTEASILYFDKLATSGMSAEWNFKTVRHLTLKEGSSASGTLENPEETEQVANAEDLVGITQAILQGQNLRENPFVKQSVKSGYRFNAMTYEYEHATEPFFIQVKAEFKGRPKVFEVTIVDYEEVRGETPTRQRVNIGDSYSKELRSLFWNNSKIIFNEIVKRG